MSKAQAMQLLFVLFVKLRTVCKQTDVFLTCNVYRFDLSIGGK